MAYRGIEAVQGPAPMGHEFIVIVQEVGSAVSTIKGVGHTMVVDGGQTVGL